MLPASPPATTTPPATSPKVTEDDDEDVATTNSVAHTGAGDVVDEGAPMWGALAAVIALAIASAGFVYSRGAHAGRK